MRKIWVLCGGPSTEYEVSLNSARLICQELALEDQMVLPVVITRQGRWLIQDRYVQVEADRQWADSMLQDAKDISDAAAGMDLGEALTAMLHEQVDCVFMGLHGQYGEDGCLQGFLETAGIPYTGSGVLASALAFDKAATIEVYRANGLSVARSIRCDSRKDPSALRNLRLPVFVKPLRGGSSVGMTFVRTYDELDAAVAKALESDSEALVEERVEGIEVSCGVVELLRDGEWIATPLSPTEIRPLHADYFDYRAKYTAGMSKEITPALLPQATIHRIQECALAAHVVLGCSGVSRTDMIIPPGDNPQPVLLETNTLPGMTTTSLLPQQARAHGMTIPELLNTLIERAISRASRGNSPAIAT